MTQVEREAKIAELQASIELIERTLNSGVTLESEDGVQTATDHRSLRTRRDELTAEVAALQGRPDSLATRFVPINLT